VSVRSRLRTYPTRTGRLLYSQFWAIGKGTPHDYAFSPTDHETRYFEVTADAGSGAYDLYDCTSASYDPNACTLRDGEQSIFSSANLAVIGETNYGATPSNETTCPNHNQGYATDAVKFGTSTNPMEKQLNNQGAWSSMAFSSGQTFEGNCVDYIPSFNAHSFIMLDSRNAQ
jgi:hypothetical protein